MQGNRVIEKGTIVIKNGRFNAVGPAGLIQIPKEAVVMDLQGTTVMPGMIDMHMHLGHGLGNLMSMQQQSFQANLAYGVTSGRDPASVFEEFGDAELLTSGHAVGPRLFTVGRAVFQYSHYQFDERADASAIAKKRVLMGGTAIKQYELPTRLQKQWLLLACEEAGLNMTNEGNDYSLWNNALEEVSMLKDGSTAVEHNPDWGDVYKDVTGFFAASGSFLSETLGIGYGPEGNAYCLYTYWNRPQDEKLKRFTQDDFFNWLITPHTPDADRRDILDSLVRYPAKIDAIIQHEGGKVTLGSHGDPEGIGAHNTLWALKMGGFTNMEALQAATIVGAESLGMQQDLGSIEVGKIADLIVLNSNPLDDIHHSRDIRYVMKDGVLYDGDTLDERWPEKKKCPGWRLHLESEKQ